MRRARSRRHPRRSPWNRTNRPGIRSCAAPKKPSTRKSNLQRRPSKDKSDGGDAKNAPSAPESVSPFERRGVAVGYAGQAPPPCENMDAGRPMSATTHSPRLVIAEPSGYAVLPRQPRQTHRGSIVDSSHLGRFAPKAARSGDSTKRRKKTPRRAPPGRPNRFFPETRSENGWRNS